MHIPKYHEEANIPVLRQVIHDYPLGVLTTSIKSNEHPTILSTHIPWVLDVQDESSASELGRLRGHLARANPQSKSVMSSLTSSEGIGASKQLEEEVLVMFTAVPHHYVTPKFYTETKPVSGKVVPTWNYIAVQAYGRATWYFDSKSDETSQFLNKQIRDLSQHAETTVMNYTGVGDQPGPWKVSDAPERYIDILKKNIIGVEIEITRLEGKFKMSQEMPRGDRKGVIEGFGRMQSDVAKDLNRIVAERDELKEAARHR